MMQELPVIFRAEKSGPHKGSVTAVFPTLPGTNQFDMTCYVHVGQHGSCGAEWYRETRPATKAESSDLLRELRGIYERDDDCRLIVRRRIIPTYYHARCAAMKGN